MIRICIPDLDIAIKLIQDGNYEEGLELFFVDSKSDQYSKHHYLYNYEMMKDILSNIGYNEINRCRFRDGITPDIEILDCREDITLFVEAKKPL